MVRTFAGLGELEIVEVAGDEDPLRIVVNLVLAERSKQEMACLAEALAKAGAWASSTTTISPNPLVGPTTRARSNATSIPSRDSQ